MEVKPPKVKRRHPWLEGRTGIHQKRLYVPGDAPLDTARPIAPKMRRSHAWLDSRNGYHRALVYVPGVTPLNSRVTNKNLKLTHSNHNNNRTLISTTTTTSINTLRNNPKRRTFNVKEWNDSMKLPIQYNCTNTLRINDKAFKTVNGRLRPCCKAKNVNVLENDWDELKLPNAVNYTRVFVPKFKDKEEFKVTEVKDPARSKESKRSTKKDTFKLPNGSITDKRSIIQCKC